MDMTTDLREYLRGRVWFPQQQGPYELLALYVLLAASTRRLRGEGRVFSTFKAVPYLYFQGPWGSGKTEAGDLMVALTGGKSSVSITEAALFRWLDMKRGKLMFFDEASGLSRQSHVLIFNAGYKRNGKVWVCERGSFTPTPFRVFGPKIFAWNKALSLSALETRCIPVEFVKASVKFVPLDRKRTQEKALRQKAREWVHANDDAIRAAHDKWRGCTDEAIFSEPRMRQIYSPLFALAEVAGILEPLREYAIAHQEQRSLRQNMSIGDKLDRVVEDLPEYCRAHNLPKWQIPFSSVNDFVRDRMDGEYVSERAIVNALVRRGYKRLDSRPGGVTCYAAPSSGLLAKAKGLFKKPA